MFQLYVVMQPTQLSEIVRRPCFAIWLVGLGWIVSGDSGEGCTYIGPRHIGCFLSYIGHKGA
jgi:hypothetical protein